MKYIALALFLTSVYAHAQCDFPTNNSWLPAHAGSGIDQATFNAMIDRAIAVYGPIFQKQGCPLVVHRSWSDPKANAQAWRSGGNCHVEMFGGLARYPGMTKRAFMLVLMHEIGHHLGGPPKYDFGKDWASVEGQSDYWATRYGMRKVMMASREASLTMATTLAKLSNKPIPSRATRSTQIVSRTREGHPDPQCRLDTFDAGRGLADRPRCWFKP